MLETYQTLNCNFTRRKVLTIDEAVKTAEEEEEASHPLGEVCAEVKV